jgi:hypothetical protein
MSKPHYIVRLKHLGQFLPLEKTQRAEVIKRGYLKTVPLSPDGRARGVPMAEIVRYQREVMGLAPLDDNALEAVPPIAERGLVDPGRQR